MICAAANMYRIEYMAGGDIYIQPPRLATIFDVHRSRHEIHRGELCALF